MAYNQFCFPLSNICWIDWNAWAAIGTLLAVVVALAQSATASRNARKRKIADDAGAATRLAIALDYELFRYGNNLVLLANSIARENILRDPTAAARSLRDAIRPSSLPLLERFLGELGVFGNREAGQLTYVLSNYHMLLQILDAPEPLERMPREILIVSFDGIHALLVSSVKNIRKSRDNMRIHYDTAGDAFTDLQPIQDRI